MRFAPFGTLHQAAEIFYALASFAKKTRKLLENDVRIRNMELFWNFLSLLGGLAMFLFGMNVMGEGLERRAGEGLKAMLGKMTNGRFRGFLLGAAVTAAIQSSSALTVMVVGFVNSGIMTLRQSIGVIMGANIGTTLTSWLLSLTGIEGGSFLVQLFKPTSFVPILAVFGVWFFVFSKKDQRRSTGQILLGFTVLIYGMERMSGAVAPLAELPAFGRLFLLFQNPVLGVLVGALLTAIIQSSSASVGILQALCVTGQLRFAAAIPIIMGQNIGTCATSMLSSVGASKNAKRAALVHLYFNLIGTVLLLGGFYLANLLWRFSFMEQTVTAFDIAAIHTLFNIASTVLLFPFARGLERLVEASVRERDGGQSTDRPLLDRRLLAAPSVAIEGSRRVTKEMAELAMKNAKEALGLIDRFRVGVSEEIVETEARVDRMEDEIGTYLLALGSRDVGEDDGAMASGLLRMIGDIERISDHAVKLAGAAKELFEKQLSLPEAEQSELGIIRSALDEMLEITSECFLRERTVGAMRVSPLRERIDELQQEIRIHHIDRMRKGEGEMVTGFILSDILNEMERISDHCANVVGCVAELSEKRMRIHAYLQDMRADGAGKDAGWKEIYRKKYALMS